MPIPASDLLDLLDEAAGGLPLHVRHALNDKAGHAYEALTMHNVGTWLATKWGWTPELVNGDYVFPVRSGGTSASSRADYVSFALGTTRLLQAVSAAGRSGVLHRLDLVVSRGHYGEYPSPQHLVAVMECKNRDLEKKFTLGEMRDLFGLATDLQLARTRTRIPRHRRPVCALVSTASPTGPAGDLAKWSEIRACRMGPSIVPSLGVRALAFVIHKRATG